MKWNPVPSLFSLLFVGLVSVAFCAAPVQKEEVKPLDLKGQKAKANATNRGKGYVPLTPAKRAYFQALSNARHGNHIKLAAMNLKLPAAFDGRTRVPLPVWDQGQCGSCYWVSTDRTFTHAGILAGMGKADDSFKLALQWGMDRPRDFGGCDGGNGTEVADYIVKNGMPAEKYTDADGVAHNDYPPYEARVGSDRTKAGAKVWAKGWTWGMVSNSGTPTTDEVKAALYLYGRLNIALDAGGQFGDGTTTITSLGNSIDHEINMVGWDDAKDGGAFLLENQWGSTWGVDGCRWITYAAAKNIVDHFWVSAGTTPPVPPDPPVPPVPPQPGVPLITSPLTAAVQTGMPFSYQITADDPKAMLTAYQLPPGLSVDGNKGLITGKVDKAGTYPILLVTLNLAGKGSTAICNLTVTDTPPVPPVPPNGGVVITLTDAQVTEVLMQLIEKLKKKGK